MNCKIIKCTKMQAINLCILLFILGSVALGQPLDNDNTSNPLKISPRIFKPDGQVNRKYLYEVAIFSENSSPHGICSGALLSSRWVLTSAFCAKSAQTLRINYGKDAVSDEPLNTAIMVDKMIVYPYFRIEGAHHDIALLKLSIPVEQTSIAYVELPKTTAQDYVGQTATVSGWGAQDSEGNIDHLLHFKKTKIIENAYCIRAGKVMTQFKLCSDKGAICEGDQGAPLVDGDTIIGIGSVGREAESNCGKDYVNVYTKVSPYVTWITNVMRVNCDTCR